VRSASVRVSSGNELSRPIEKLYPLEVSHELEDQRNDREKEEDQKKDTPTPRPTRLAARQAAQKIKELYEDMKTQ